MSEEEDKVVIHSDKKMWMRDDPDGQVFVPKSELDAAHTRIAELEAEVQRAIDFGHSMYAAAEKQAWNAALEAAAECCTAELRNTGFLLSTIPRLTASAP